MKKLLVASAAALLMVGCGGNKNKPEGASSKLAPEPNPMTARNTTPANNTGGYTDPGNTVTTQPPQTTVVDTTPAAPPAPAAGKKYVVQRGDTLWSIATRTYGDGKQYKKIVAANPAIKGDRIAVGQSLVLP